jgi:hypothetical protein
MAKPRIIIPISLQFSVRYLLRTGLLDRMRSFCEPVILLAWQDSGLERELATVGEVHSMVKSQWGSRYERARGVINAWHLRHLASPSTPIRERRANLDRSFAVRMRRSAHLMTRRLIPYWPGALASVRQQESQLLWKDTNAREVQRQVKPLGADGVFCLTPFIPDEELTVRVCSLEGMPSCASILSFDNLTTRSWIPIIFDSYLLWNRYNAEQLRRGYPESGASQVSIVGSPQFDFYWDSRYIWDEQDWRRSLRLPASRPVILFGGGYFTCAPQEPRFLLQLDQAIERHEIPGDPLILFRRHPVDPIARWEPILRNAKNVVHDDPWEFRSPTLGHTNVLHEDIAKLASTLYHTVAHVNVASTMSVDGAILDRPQVGPAYDDSPGRRYHRAAYECYQQEHFLPILESEGLTIARSRAELIEGVRSAILNPGERRAGRERIVREICTFNDGKATDRVVDAVAAFVAGNVRPGTLKDVGRIA